LPQRDIAALGNKKKKGYKNAISNLTQGTTSFQALLCAPMQPFSSLLYK
jgi:hypothetical protein